MRIEPLVGPEGHVPILIRDDDTSFFTKRSMLETVYSKAWNDEYKVSLSIVPFQKCGDDLSVPPEMRKTESVYSILENKQLVNFIRRKIQDKSLEILQHGLFHTTNSKGRGEFAGCSRSIDEIARGRKVLEEAFGLEPKFFVPPYEDISNRNAKAILKSGMIPICRQTNFDKFLRSSYFPEFAKQIIFGRVGRRSRNIYLNENVETLGVNFVRPVNIEIKNEVVYWSLPEIKLLRITSFDSLLDLLTYVADSCILLRRPLCIINHYYIYFYDWNTSITRSELFKTWHKMLEYFYKSPIIWKTTFAELYNRVSKVKKVSLASTGSKVTVESEEEIKDFCFRTGTRLEPSPYIITDEDYHMVTVKHLLPHKRIVLYKKD